MLRLLAIPSAGGLWAPAFADGTGSAQRLTSERNRVMPKPIQIQGKDYYLNLDIVRGITATGEVNFVIELYDEEPSFTDGQASVGPVKAIQGLGDAASLYYQLETALEVLKGTS